MVVGYEVRINGEIVATRDATSWFSDTLIAGRAYRAEVRAVDDEGDRSDIAMLRFVGGHRAPPPDTGTGSGSDTEGPDPGGETLATPTGLRASVYSRTAAELFWYRAATPGLSYEIARDGAVLGTTDGTSLFDSGLSAGRRYAYALVAIDAAGSRSTEAMVTVSTPTRTSVACRGHASGGRTRRAAADAAIRSGVARVLAYRGRTVLEQSECRVAAAPSTTSPAWHANRSMSP